MAEANNPAPAPAAAPNAPSSLSPPSPSPSAAAPAPVAQPAGASPSPAPAGDPPTRPDWLPEKYWDATAGKAKEADFRKDYDELSAFKAADDSRRLTLPQKPEDYQVTTSKEFKAPEGASMTWNMDDPGLKMAREFAQKAGLTQDQFSGMLDIYAGQVLAQQQHAKAAYDNEKTKLGAAGQSRIDAILQWGRSVLGDEGGKVLANSLWTADQVKMFETILSKFTSQGAANFSQQHRDNGPTKLTDEQYAKMSYGEKMDYARKHGNGAGAKT